jgi:hypothetical protein
MTLLYAMREGAMIAAELLAMLLVPPAVAHEPAAIAAHAAQERPVQLHRLSTTVDIRLLGSLADVRVAQSVHNVSPATVDLAAHMPVIDEHVDALWVVHATRATELLRTAECGDMPGDGHARLSEDERIADAFQLAPGSRATIEAIATQPLAARGRSYRAMLPVRLEEASPWSALFEQDGRAFLLLVPQRTAQRATLVLRPASGAPESIDLGSLDTRHAVLVPLAHRSQLAGLRAGAIELEMVDRDSTTWLTLAVDTLDEQHALRLTSE